MKASFRSNLPWSYRLLGLFLIPLQVISSAPLSLYAVTTATRAHKISLPQQVKVSRSARDTSTFSPSLKFSDDPSDIDIRMARVFFMPLIPTSSEGNKTENQALASALLNFHKRTDPEDLSSLTNFLTKYPQSRWKAALQYNLGVLHYETGYLSAALGEWKDSWNLTKNADSGELHALADGAFGRLSVLSAQLGRTEDLKSLFAETKGRGFYGAAEQQVRAAKSGYRTMQEHPSIAFKCGPFALDSIRTASKNVHPRSAIVQTAASTSQGTSLAMVKNWSDQLNLKYQIAKRTTGAPLVVPSVMHWKLGHFGALVRFKNGKYLIQDPTFAGYELWVSAKALEQETSGYFLIPSGPLPAGWTTVSMDEASKVWGRGGAQNQDMGSITPNDAKNGCPGSSPMTSPQTFSMLASLYLQDTPVRYQVPVGPDPDFTVSYAYETSTPPLFSYSNFGYDWSFQYISFVTVDGSQNVTVTLPGGGTETANYSAFDDVNNVYPPDIKSHAQIYLDSTGVYDRHLPDGSRQVYSQPDGTGRIFLKQIFDPQGNSLILNYDANFRLTSVQDQLGQLTAFTYLSNTAGNVGFYKITKITDPFGRYASFQYDSANTVELIQITDVLGITSQFTYDINYFIDSLTTPYGRTTFNQYIPNSDSDGESGLRITWPDGTQSITENYIGHELNSYYWDRKSSPMYPNKLSASVTNWLLDANSRTESGIANSTQQALEGAVQYSYPNGYYVSAPVTPPPPPEDNFTHRYTGSSNLPVQISRALDNGDTQLYQFSYNAIGRVTQVIDPLARAFTYYYDGNNIDLLQVRQTKGSNNDLLLRNVYNSLHEPLSSEDGSGQTTTYTYNSLGQILTQTAPSPGGTTTFNYNASHYLTSIDGPLSGSNDSTTFTYDGYGRIYTVADSEGYTLTFGYDAYDRPTTVTYPDGTYEQVSWNLLDPGFLRDRLGNWTGQQFNSLRQLVGITDPLGRTTAYQWCTCGALGSLTDAAGHVTSWTRDLEGRPTVKTFPDGSTITYGYETNTSRLKTVTDALSQVKTYSYYDDNMLSGVVYTGAIHSTSSVSCSYDANYPRLTSIGNGYGTLTYSYNPYLTDPYASATTGAGRVSQITNSALGSSAVTYAYDALGRVTNRSINSTANASTWSYDAMNRVTSIANPLGTFTPAYVDQGASGGDKGTTRLASFTYPNGQVTNYSYFSTTYDERLQQINNLASGSSVLSQFNYTYDSKGQIASWKQQADSNAATRYDLAYDAAGQLSNAVLKTDSTNAILHQYYYNFDADGNRTSEQVDGNITKATPNSLNQLSSLASGGPTRFQGTISQPGTVTVNGQAASQATSTNFLANPVLSGGTNTVAVVATNGNNVSQTNNYQVVVPPSSTISPTYDADGNMTSNGNGQTYAWDAENRLITIAYTGGATSNFAYDALGRRVSIIEENSGGTVTGTKQFVWCGSQMGEERDATGTTVTRRFYPQGEQIAGTNYYYTRDHLGSIREMTTSGGISQTRSNYDPFGRMTNVPVNGSASLYTAVSRLTHASAGTFDVPLNLLNNPPSIEPRVGNGTNADQYTIVFTFAQTVTGATASVTAGTGSVSGTPVLSGSTVTVNLQGVIQPQNITVMLSNVTFSSAATIPSASVTIGILTGDVNQSGTVDLTDMSIVSANGGNIPNATNFLFDLDRSGNGASQDMRIVRNNTGHQLVAPAPSFGYAGYYQHQTSGLNLTLYRAYDPNTAKWLSRDPLEENGGINLYGYVGNDPANMIDPLGLWQFSVGGGLGIGGQLTFGDNNGSWNLGGTIGLGVGLSGSYDPSNSDPNQVDPSSPGSGNEHQMGLKASASAGAGVAGVSAQYTASAKWDDCNSSVGDSLKAGIKVGLGKVGARAGVDLSRGRVNPQSPDNDHTYSSAKISNPAITLGGSAFVGFTASNTFR